MAVNTNQVNSSISQTQNAVYVSSYAVTNYYGYHRNQNTKDTIERKGSRRNYTYHSFSSHNRVKMNQISTQCKRVTKNQPIARYSNRLKVFNADE